MFKRKTIFIGCGDGREILPFVRDREHLLLGLEPIEQLYLKAIEALNGFPHVSIIKRRIQDWTGTEYQGSIDNIYCIFPTPQVLRYEAEEIIKKACLLLAKGGGRLRVYTEVTLSGWPDAGDTAGLQELLRVLGESELSLSVNEVDFQGLPRTAKESHCGVLFKAHNLTGFTAIEARKQ